MVGRDVSLRSESAAAAVGLTEAVVAEIVEEAADAPATVADEAPPVLRVVDATLRGRDGRVLLDVRTVRPDEEVALVEAVCALRE